MSLSRIEMTDAEMYSLVRQLTNSPDSSMTAIRDQLARKLLKLPANNRLLKAVDLSGMTVALAGIERNLMARIINGISLITKIPEAQITASSKLSNLRLTPTKRDQLRIHINQFIRQNGGTILISLRQMDGFKTVQDIFNFAITLLP